MERSEEKVAEEKKTIVEEIQKGPLPVQVVLRALQHFTAKAKDGADIRFFVDEEKPCFQIWTKKSMFRYEEGWLILEIARKTETLIKKARVNVNTIEEERRIVNKLGEIFAVAVKEDVVLLGDVLELFQKEQEPQ